MLIKCPECGNDISEFSVQCPHCGCPSMKYFSNENDFIFEKRDDGLFITKYCGSACNVVIPANYNGEKVVGIGENAFSKMETISSVKISEGIKYIADNAFDCCKSLSVAIFPSTLITIGNSAFHKCRLKEIKLFEGLQEIGKHCFSFCVPLNKIEMPKSVTMIGGHAFYFTAWMLEQQKKNPLVVVNNILIDGEKAKGNIRIPYDVSKIASYAFYDNFDMESVLITRNVQEIGYMAFSGCVKLKTVDIEEGVETIRHSAFANSRALSLVNIPSSVTHIGGAAFCPCPNLSVFCARSRIAPGWALNWVDENATVTWESKFPLSAFRF